jgi:ribonuclease-3
VLRSGKNRDPKSTFQEQAQEHHSLTPRYDVLQATGPDHSKQFTVGVYLGPKLEAKGTGSSKQEAQVAAAAAALKAKGW